MIPISSRADRLKQGKALRLKTPRETHADLTGEFSRNAVDPVRERQGSRAGACAGAVPAHVAGFVAADLAGQPFAGIPVQPCRRPKCHFARTFGPLARKAGRIGTSRRASLRLFGSKV
jgi:hypothetical protein